MPGSRNIVNTSTIIGLQALIVWGPQDHYMPEKSGRAYLRDLPDAEFQVLDGGHWLLETNLDEVVALVVDFLSRVHT